MIKQCVVASIFTLIISINAMEDPSKGMIPSGSRSSNVTQAQTLYDLERESFDAVTFSKDLPLLSKEFCEQVISSLPIEVKTRVKRLINAKIRNRVLPDAIIFHGPSGSGKTLLARVVEQEMDMPFLIVKGSMLANEYVNSGACGLRRIGKLAAKIKGNVIVNEADSLAKKKNKKNEHQSDDETAKALWEMLDMIGEHKLLFIGTTNDVAGMPEQLQERLKGSMLEVPYLDHPLALQQVIRTCLNGEAVDSNKTVERLSKEVKGCSNRDINKVVFLALGLALDRNPDSPIVTFADFKASLMKIKKDGRLLSRTDWDKKEYFNYAVQTIGAAANIISILNSIVSLKNNFESLRIALASLKHQARGISLQEKSLITQQIAIDLQQTGLKYQQVGAALQEKSVASQEKGLEYQAKGIALQEKSLEKQEEGLRMQEVGLHCQAQSIGLQEKGLQSQNTGIALQEKGLEKQERGLALQENGLRHQIKSTGFQERGIQLQEKGIVLQESGLEKQERGLGMQQSGLQHQAKGVDLQEKGLKSQEKGLEMQGQSLETQQAAFKYQKWTTTLPAAVGAVLGVGYDGVVGGVNLIKAGYNWVAGK